MVNIKNVPKFYHRFGKISIFCLVFICGMKRLLLKSRKFNSGWHNSIMHLDGDSVCRTISISDVERARRDRKMQGTRIEEDKGEIYPLI